MARHRPHDPAKVAQATAERKARDAEAKRLESQGATVRRDRAGHIISAFRSNVFNLLLARGTISQAHHDAAAQLAEAWAIWKGLDGRDIIAEFVDNGRTPPHQRILVTDRQLRAGRELYGDDLRVGILNELNPTHRKLMEAFMVATVEEDRAMMWRGIVERETGEIVRERQTRLVVDAMDELCAAGQQSRERAA